MKLTSRQVAKLSAIEQTALEEIVAPVRRQSRRALFQAQSKAYVKDDEKILPYPERSSKGFWLEKFGEKILDCTVGLVLKARNPELSRFVQLKLRKQLPGTSVYTSPREEILAAVYQGESPFSYWRDNRPLELPSVPEEAIVVIDPSPAVLKHVGDEFALSGAYIKSEDIEATISMLESPENEDTAAQWIRLLAEEGLTHVTPLDRGIWLDPLQRNDNAAEDLD